MKCTAELRVIYADTDAMGVVYHTNYIKWFEIGRGEYLRQVGFPYHRLEQECGVMLPVVECSCKYKTPARYDDVVEIWTETSEVKAATITLHYEIRLKTTGALLVSGMTKHAVTDTKLRPVRLKEKAPELLQKVMTDCEKPE